MKRKEWTHGHCVRGIRVHTFYNLITTFKERMYLVFWARTSLSQDHHEIEHIIFKFQVHMKSTYNIIHKKEQFTRIKWILV